MSLKVHLYDHKTDLSLPGSERAKFHADGYKGTLCGLMGVTTREEAQVDCKRCAKRIREADLVAQRREEVKARKEAKSGR